MKEKCINRRGNSFRIRIYYRGVCHTKTVSIVDGDEVAALRNAKQVRDDMKKALRSVVPMDFKPELLSRGDYTPMLLAARKRPNYQLTRDEEDWLIAQHEGFCSLTGLPFQLPSKKYKRNPWGPSLDRIDSSKGYTLDNVRIVCVSVNLAMNEWGEEVFGRVAAAYWVANTDLLPTKNLGGLITS